MNNDKIERVSTNRRGFIRGAAAVGVGATLAPYLGRAGIVGATTVPAGGDALNPFGMAENSTVDAVIFNGGYGIDYVEFAADIFEQVHEGSTAEVSPSTQIGPELQPRFVGGNPPDLIDNSGAQSIGFQTILDQLEDLTDVIDAPNLEGVPIRDTLYGGVLAPGTFEGKLAAINYALTVYAIWYSSSLFDGQRMDPADDLGRGPRARRGGCGTGQVPVLLGPGGGDVLPDDVHRLGDQARGRRGPPGPGEPDRRLLVVAGRCRKCSPGSRRSSTPATCSPAVPAPSSRRPRRSGASTSRPCSTRRDRGSRTR